MHEGRRADQEKTGAGTGLDGSQKTWVWGQGFR
jgi:hypothetical protein